MKNKWKNRQLCTCLFCVFCVIRWTPVSRMPKTISRNLRFRVTPRALDLISSLSTSPLDLVCYKREEESDRRERTDWIPGNGKFVVEAQGERRRISRAIALVIVTTREFSIYHSNRAHAADCPTSRIVSKWYNSRVKKKFTFLKLYTIYFRTRNIILLFLFKIIEMCMISIRYFILQ